MSFRKIGLSGGASPWRVCYQQGPPRLVFVHKVVLWLDNYQRAISTFKFTFLNLHLVLPFDVTVVQVQVTCRPYLTDGAPTIGTEQDKGDPAFQVLKFILQRIYLELKCIVKHCLAGNLILIPSRYLRLCTALLLMHSTCIIVPFNSQERNGRMAALVEELKGKVLNQLCDKYIILRLPTYYFEGEGCCSPICSRSYPILSFNGQTKQIFGYTNLVFLLTHTICNFDRCNNVTFHIHSLFLWDMHITHGLPAGGDNSAGRRGQGCRETH